MATITDERWAEMRAATLAGYAADKAAWIAAGGDTSISFQTLADGSVISEKVGDSSENRDRLIAAAEKELGCKPSRSRFTGSNLRSENESGCIGIRAWK